MTAAAGTATYHEYSGGETTETGGTEFHFREEVYQYFLNAVEAHHDIRVRRLDERLLNRALPRMKNLRSIVLSNLQHVDPVPDDKDGTAISPSAREWRRFTHARLFPFPPVVDWKVVLEDYDFFDPDEEDLKEWRDIDYYDDQWDAESITYTCSVLVCRPFRGFSILLKALAGSATKMESFTIRPQYKRGSIHNYTAGISHWLFAVWSDRLDQMISIFQNLRKLQLVIGSEGSGPRKKTDMAAFVGKGHMTRVLKSAVCLEELELELYDISVLSAMGSDAHYKHLRSFKVLDSLVEPLELLAFLERDRDTLIALELAYCRSTTIAWSSFFNHMRLSRMCFPTIKGAALYDPKDVISSGVVLLDGLTSIPRRP